MNKKIQLIFTTLVVFTSISIASEREWREVHRDVANDMRSMGYGPSTEEMQETEGAFIEVPKKDFDNYEQEKNQKGEKISWVNPPVRKTFSNSTEVSLPILEEIRKNRAAENKATNFEIDVKDRYTVSQEDYNRYYYNQLPWYKRWATNISSLFTQKPSQS